MDSLTPFLRHGQWLDATPDLNRFYKVNDDWNLFISSKKYLKNIYNI